MIVAAPVTAAPALQSSKNISPNTQPAATFLTSLSPSGVRYLAWQDVKTSNNVDNINNFFILN